MVRTPHYDQLRYVLNQLTGRRARQVPGVLLWDVRTLPGAGGLSGAVLPGGPGRSGNPGPFGCKDFLSERAELRASGLVVTKVTRATQVKF